jgi:enamine deaminase RidA (YjgF/YER057c/UK114 family)
MADNKAVNPWTWQDALAFSQGVETRGATRVLHCAGQASVDGDGNVLHAGNMAAQLNQAFDNLETVLGQAGFALTDVVRLNYYVTDVQAFSAAGATIGGRLASVPVKPCGVLLGVSSLFHPDAMVEIEATAVA